MAEHGFLTGFRATGAAGPVLAGIATPEGIRVGEPSGLDRIGAIVALHPVARGHFSPATTFSVLIRRLNEICLTLNQFVMRLVHGCYDLTPLPQGKGAC